VVRLAGSILSAFGNFNIGCPRAVARDVSAIWRLCESR
jgi:hypothetical protein